MAKDRSHLIPTQVVDVNGVSRKVYVSPDKQKKRSSLDNAFPTIMPFRDVEEEDGDWYEDEDGIDYGSEAEAWEDTVISESAQDWIRAGFSTPDEALGWEDAGFSPLAAQEWDQEGFDCNSAKEWSDGLFGTAEANRWSEKGFAPDDAGEWSNAGFTDPDEADSWARATNNDLEMAQLLRDSGVTQMAVAARWISIYNSETSEYTLDEMIDFVGTDAHVAEAYAESFHVKDWRQLGSAHVTVDQAPYVFGFFESIRALDAEQTKGNPTDFLTPEQEESHHAGMLEEAIAWARSTAKLNKQRAHLIYGFIDRGLSAGDVQFVIGDSGDNSIYSNLMDGAADHALLANKLLMESDYEFDDEGFKAYRLLYTALDKGKADSAAMVDVDNLVSEYGVRKVADALDLGFANGDQIRHHLNGGGPAELSRGIL